MSDATSLLPDGRKRRNEQMQIVFTTEEFLDVAAESRPEWGLNPQPLNSVQTLKATELSDRPLYICIYIYIYIKKNIYIYI